MRVGKDGRRKRKEERDEGGKGGGKGEDRKGEEERDEGGREGRGYISGENLHIEIFSDTMQ